MGGLSLLRVSLYPIGQMPLGEKLSPPHKHVVGPRAAFHQGIERLVGKPQKRGRLFLIHQVWFFL
jgi:hypothetical protein